MAFQEREGVHLSDSTIWEWVKAEGFRWKRQESWFHNAEKADPEFVENKSPSMAVSMFNFGPITSLISENAI